MATDVTPIPRTNPSSATVPGIWPVDVLLAGYLAATGVLIGIYYHQVRDAGLLLLGHAVMLGLMGLAIRYPRPMAAFRHWYPLPYVTVCYREMALLIPAVRSTTYDFELARLDYHLWGAHASVWIERWHYPWLTELLQAAYTLFVPLVLLVAFLLWIQRRYAEFRYYAFLVALAFLVSYVGYLAVPVRGPRFFLAHLQHFPLHGIGLFVPMQRLLDQIESVHYDCFPSGHTMLILIAWWNSRRISRELFAAYSVCTLLIVIATIYLRYHYTIDIFAGAALAAALLGMAPVIYARALRPLRAEEDL